MPPLVSILIPVFNTRQWVGAAIDSALAQTWPDTEVIVLDDGSTDGSLDVVRAYAGRVRIHTQSNGGQNVSRNRLTEFSRGDWLVYLDADDELSADAVRLKLEAAGDADAVYGSMDVCSYEDGRLVRTTAFPAGTYPDTLAAAFMWKYPNTSSFMFRRTAVQEVSGWNESIRSCTDYDLYFRLLLTDCLLRAAPASVSVYRLWSRQQASLEDLFRQTTTRLEVMWGVARQLDRDRRWTDAARSAFYDAALGVIRILHLVDSRRAAAEFERLRSWNPRLRPSPANFPAGYRAALRLLGFSRAERVADTFRLLRTSPLPVMNR